VLELSNPVQAYAWGEQNGIAKRTGSEPSGGPEAELWVGAHRLAPSRLVDGTRLDEAIADDPDRLLGPEVIDAFGPRLPFLLKVLAIGSPLSIQVHPSQSQAEDGFAREEASGLPADDPRRSYRDPQAKPELLVALEPTWVLAGLRGGAEAAETLRAAGDARLGALAERVAGSPDARDALVHLLTAGREERDELARTAATFDPDDERWPERRWVGRLAAAFPGDPTALAPLLLHVRRLDEGEAIFVPAGVPHAYLHGAAIELMGSSDNVVRGGLTPKHIDTNELVELLAPPGTDITELAGEPDDGRRTYRPDAAEIALVRARPADRTMDAPDGRGPALAVATGGDSRVEVDGDVATLGRGRAVFVPPTERARCRLGGPGTIWWATVGGPGTRPD
jgi:mannose-6-phosphate isomerase